MLSHRYTVRRLHLLPLAKFGCLLGGLAMFLPGLICAIVSSQLVSALSVLLEQWRDAEVDIGLGLPLGLDFVKLLGLEAVEMLLGVVDGRLIGVGEKLFSWDLAARGAESPLPAT